MHSKLHRPKTIYCLSFALYALPLSSALADFRDDIDYTKLKNEYGASLPTGQGVRMIQVEYVRDGAWAPDTSGELAGKALTYRTALWGGISNHAQIVSQYLAGSSTSIVPGLTGWGAFEATDYTGRGSLNAGLIWAPQAADWDIENHSWGGNNAIFAVNILQRLDYRIERDNVVALAGVDNYATSTMSQMIANSYNSIAVGSSTGDHAVGTTLEVSGRMKPDLVGTRTWTSYATPIVSSCAALLIGEINRSPSLAAARSSLAIKAILMAGATKDEFPDWSHSPSRPLDVIYGAGEVNIYNSYKILMAGRQPVSSSSVNTTGWDVNTTSNSSRSLYFFTVPSGQTMNLSAILAWNRHITADSQWLNVTYTLNNLDLALWQSDSSHSLKSKLDQSVSTIDNVEHIFEKTLGAGTYALEVVSPVSGEKYGLAWQGVLSGGSSGGTTTPSVPTVPSVPVTTPSTPSAPAFVDASFEANNVGSNAFGAFAYNPSSSAWTFSSTSGISGNNSGFTQANPSAPAGGQVGFIQMTGTITQNVTFSAGTYTISAQIAQRGIWQQQAQTVVVSVDGKQVGTFKASGSAYENATTSAFTVTDGAHTVQFTGQATADATLFVDNLSIAAAAAPATSGSTNAPMVTFADSNFETANVGANNFYAFAYNPSSTPWTFSSTSGVSGNNSGFTQGNPVAPAGNQVGFIQMTGTITQNVTFSAGTYTISAQIAQRGNYQQQAQTVLVSVDGKQVGTFKASGTAYENASTSAFTVAAGPHTVQFAGQATADGTLFIDNVTVGASGSSVPTFTPVAVTVPGSGFENPTLGSSNFYAFQYNPATVTSTQPWTFQGYAGISGNNSGFTQSNSNAPEGGQVAFIQMNTGVMSQSLTFPSSGTYTLTVLASQRGIWNLQDQIVNVYLDDITLVGSIYPHTTSYQTFTLSFPATGGNHKLSFKGTATADGTVFLDNINLTQTAP